MEARQVAATYGVPLSFMVMTMYYNEAPDEEGRDRGAADQR